MDKVKIEKFKTSEINPRKISKNNLEKLKHSISSFTEMMEMRPLVVDENFQILGGNQRFTAIKELGYEEIPKNWFIQKKGLSEKQKREFIIRDNTHYGDWDFDALNTDWESHELNDWGIDFKAGKGKDFDPFDDEAIEDTNQYGVIVMCGDEKIQEDVFNRLTKEGYNCKIVVT